MSGPIRQSNWYSVEEVAELLSVHPESVRNWIRADEVKTHYLGKGRAGGYRIEHAELIRIARERYPNMRLVFEEDE